jgi:uncharacterized coiled-coil protein SlyX
MSPSPLTIDVPADAATSEREQQIAKLNKALYPADRQEKFLNLQAEVESLLQKLQSLKPNHTA